METNKLSYNEVVERMKAIDEIDEKTLPGEELRKINDEYTELEVRFKELESGIEKRKSKINEVVNLPDSAVIRNFNNQEERKMEFNKETVLESAEYRSAWVKALQGKELNEVEKKAYATTDTHNAVPTLTSNKFFEKMKKLAPMLSEITLMRVAGNLKFMAEGTRNAAAAHTENTAVTPAADTVVSVSLGGYEFMKVIRISASASNMSIAGFEDWLVEMLSGDLARAIDNYIINDSTNGIAAITYATTLGNLVVMATTQTEYEYKDIISLVALLPAAYDAEAKFLVNKSVLFNDIKGIVDSSGRPLFDPVEKTLMGYPVIVDDYVSTAANALYLGKWTDIVGNLSQDVTVERSVESGFLNNSIDYRGVAVFDSKPAKKDAIVKLVSTTA